MPHAKKIMDRNKIKAVGIKPCYMFELAVDRLDELSILLPDIIKTRACCGNCKHWVWEENRCEKEDLL